MNLPKIDQADKAVYQRPKEKKREKGNSIPTKRK
jgi:hypothetical protein